MIGIDEVGRGAWAGPLLVVAARQIGTLPLGLADSKILSKQSREDFMPAITQNCDIGEGWVEPIEIDSLGLSASMKLGVERALKQIQAMSNESIIMDGKVNYCDPVFTKVQCVIKADKSIPVVSAASIYAKVTRDRLLIKQDAHYPNHGFGKHVGYGTKAHLEALQTAGITPLHRLSYKPIKAFYDNI